MKIKKRPASSIHKEEAHGGSGARKVYANTDDLDSVSFEAMTHGFLPAGATFDWHDHPDIEEIMIVIKGDGEVHDDDGKYSYSPGDVFIYPANIRHKIHNPTDYEHEMIFVRISL